LKVTLVSLDAHRGGCQLCHLALPNSLNAMCCHRLGYVGRTRLIIKKFIWFRKLLAPLSLTKALIKSVKKLSTLPNVLITQSSAGFILWPWIKSF
jgi:hypothetical protein